MVVYNPVTLFMYLKKKSVTSLLIETWTFRQEIWLFQYQSFKIKGYLGDEHRGLLSKQTCWSFIKKILQSGLLRNVLLCIMLFTISLLTLLLLRNFLYKLHVLKPCGLIHYLWLDSIEIFVMSQKISSNKT